MRTCVLFVLVAAACGGSRPAVSDPSSRPPEPAEPSIMRYTRVADENLYQPRNPRPRGHHRVEVDSVRVLAEEQPHGLAGNDKRGVVLARFRCRPGNVPRDGGDAG
jgi:hypothetical protein